MRIADRAVLVTGPIAASTTEDEQAKGQMYYNYKTGELMSDEMPGLSVFYKDESGAVFHTYSTYARGRDMLVGTYNFRAKRPRRESGIDGGLGSPPRSISCLNRNGEK